MNDQQFLSIMRLVGENNLAKETLIEGLNKTAEIKNESIQQLKKQLAKADEELCKAQEATKHALKECDLLRGRIKILEDETSKGQSSR